MARENQGLQIALIIFVMLTLALSVTTYLFFSQYQESAEEARKARGERDENHGFPPQIVRREAEVNYLTVSPAVRAHRRFTRRATNRSRAKCR